MIQKISAPVKSILLFVLAFTIFSRASCSQLQTKLKNKDRKKDIEFVTTDGTIILRLSDSTPLHRDNFLRLVKSVLDQNYTVFGEVIRGMETIDRIAAVTTSKGQDMDRPLTDIQVISGRLIKRRA
ncbi:MAG: peptidylprolyl isomerase, partial [Bacteroidota bacterium]|nr:peptidylprolyl isomerase [Bacteroidota bacterium]